MPTPWMYYVNNPDLEEYEGPYLTKEEALSDAVLCGFFEEVDVDNIEIEICEGTCPLIDEIIVDGRDVLGTLEGTIWELSMDMHQEHIDELTTAMSNAFRMWARDHNAKFYELSETRNSEIVTLPKSDHARKILE